MFTQFTPVAMIEATRAAYISMALMVSDKTVKDFLINATNTNADGAIRVVETFEKAFQFKK